MYPRVVDYWAVIDVSFNLFCSVCQLTVFPLLTNKQYPLTDTFWLSVLKEGYRQPK